LISNSIGFSVLSYDIDFKPVELLSVRLNKERCVEERKEGSEKDSLNLSKEIYEEDFEVLEHCSFLDDQKPSVILLLTSVKMKQLTKLRLLSINNEDNRPFKQVIADLEVKK